MAEREVTVLCYWNGCIKYGHDGVYYEGSAPQKIRVNQKTRLSKLLDWLYLVTGLDKQRSKFDIIGRYPSVVRNSMVKKYVPIPVSDDASLETMLKVPSIHPSLKNVELYLEVKPSLVNPVNSSKRQRTQERMMDTNLDGCFSKVVVDSGVSKPSLVSSLWIDNDHELRVGLCFKDRDELKKAVEWCSIRGRRKCVVRETEKDVYTFECVRWKCKWSLWAVKREEHGPVEVTKYTGPHTCCPEEPEVSESEFLADEVERVITVHPTLSVSELKKWWFEITGYKVKTPEMKKAKLEAMSKIYGDWDQSFRLLPKLMAALQSSNGMVVDWQYNVFPNPEFASFRGVFWAFSQSIEGFRHCRPLIVVDTKDLNGKYPMKLMIASGIDAEDYYFPLAFAFTKEVSSDTWRWFLSGIREKVTQRKGICLISSPHPDILTVIKDPESRWKEPWAYHRFCLNHLCSQFHDIFKDDYLKNLVHEAGSTEQEDEFDSDMKEIEEKNPEARRWLDQFPPHQWALAHDNGRRYGFLTVEDSFQLEAWESIEVFGLTIAMLCLFDELRSNFDICCRISRGSRYCGYPHSELVMDKLKEFTTSSFSYIITPLERDAFHVADPLENEEWIVQLDDLICTCGKFQGYKFPCLHALAVCDELKINPLQYVDDCYTLERCYKTYSGKFNPVPEVSAWPEASGVPRLVLPCPPDVSCKSKRERLMDVE